jgi:hypothetical protein
MGNLRMRSRSWTLRTPYGVSRGITRYFDNATVDKGQWWLLTHSDETGDMTVDVLAAPPLPSSLDPQAVVAELRPRDRSHTVRLHAFASDRTRPIFRREMPLAWRALQTADPRLRPLRARIVWHAPGHR